jgi:hypothetical protein
VSLVRLEALGAAVRCVLATAVAFVLCLGVLELSALPSGASTPSWVASGGGDYPDYVCAYDTDGGCDPGNAPAALLTGPLTLTLTGADDSSGQDIELAFQSATGPAGTCVDYGYIDTPDYYAEGGGGFPSCTMPAGETLLATEYDYGPYVDGADTGGAFSAAVGPDAVTYFDPGYVLTSDGGGGSSSGVVGSAFTLESGTFAGYVELGAGLVAALLALGLGVRALVRWSRRAAVSA